MLKPKNIELECVSRYRGELMGAAMLFVMLFHVYLPRDNAFFGLRRCGNVGVDMFLFLSGVGLWYSWTKTPSLRHFFKNRYIRVYPAWFIMACLYYIPLFDGHSYLTLIGEITFNSSFWLHDELNFWYVPCTMMLYTFAPAYMNLIRKHPVYRWLPALMILWCVVVQWVAPVNAAVGHIEIFWSRVPIFFIGINCGALVKAKTKVDGASLWLIIITFVSSFGTCVYLEQVLHDEFPIFIERMVYIPFTISGILLLCIAFRHAPSWFNGFWRMFGAISLEIYLIHLHFVMDYVAKYQLGYWLTSLLTIVISMPLAWLLHKLIEICIVNVVKKHERARQ
jgi:peptidoglycan/LPS O-acetylase OafA/YrhL